MAESLWQISWSCRFHSEAAVRRSVVIAVLRILSLPKLIIEEMEEITEAIEWIKELKTNDPDDSVREAASILTLNF